MNEGRRIETIRRSQVPHLLLLPVSAPCPLFTTLPLFLHRLTCDLSPAQAFFILLPPAVCFQFLDLDFGPPGDSASLLMSGSLWGLSPSL